MFATTEYGMSNIEQRRSPQILSPKTTISCISITFLHRINAPHADGGEMSTFRRRFEAPTGVLSVPLVDIGGVLRWPRSTKASLTHSS